MPTPRPRHTGVPEGEGHGAAPHSRARVTAHVSLLIIFIWTQNLGVQVSRRGACWGSGFVMGNKLGGSTC